MKFTLQNSLKAAAAVTTVCVVAPAAWAQGIGVRTLNELMVPTPQKLERGQKLWKANCVSCHGADGAGNGPQAQYFSTGVSNLKAGEYRHGAGLLETHDAIAKGTNGHPLFEHLPYQDLWAVTHFARSLGPVPAAVDPPEVVKKAMFEAKEGVCSPTVKSGINDKMKFQGDAQIAAGEAAFASNCSACHGAEGKGDGTAAAALSPKPRDFTSGDGWTKGTSALAIFDTLANGIDGTAMASFKHLPEADRWALTHLIREKWLPASAKAEASEAEVEAVCRALTGGGSTESISIDLAMKYVAEDVEEGRIIRMKQYGTAWIADGADANRGQATFEKHCQSCHGPRGVGTTLGPYGAQPPYLVVKVNRLEPGLAGGTYEQFAARSLGGAHIAIPDLTGASHIAKSDWASLHAYVASFEGQGEVRPAAERPAPAAADVVPTEGTEAAPGEAAPAAQKPKAPVAPPKPKPAVEAAPKEQPAAASQE